jgi:hypothetical protein
MRGRNESHLSITPHSTKDDFYMKIFANSKRIRFGRNSARIAPLALAIAFGTMSCQQEVPTRSDAETTRPAIAARNPIGSTAPETTWIYNLTDLRNMTNMGGYYKLANNIVASATAQTPFVPIGYTKDFFRGTFDGNNKTITNLKIVGTGNFTGIFTKTYNAVLKNIRLVNVNVSGGITTGAIAGYAENVDLRNSYVTGKVTGNSLGDRLGLAFGSAGNFTRIYRCYFKGRVNGRGYHFGGVVGYAAFSGVLDQNDDARIMLDEIFVQDTIDPTLPSGSAMVAAGGLVGTLIGGAINNVNVVAQVTGRHAAGGLVGNIINDDPNSVGSYIRGGLSRGVVTDAGTPNRTGAIGNMSGSLIWSGGAYYDTDTDGGSVNPNIDPACQNGFNSATLKAPHPSPNRLLHPYIYGMLITQAMIDEDANDNVVQCHLASGSDGDWGFGTCGQTAIWAANTDTEYSTLLRIPDPGVQPKN